MPRKSREWARGEERESSKPEHTVPTEQLREHKRPNRRKTEVREERKTRFLNFTAGPRWSVSELPVQTQATVQEPHTHGRNGAPGTMRLSARTAVGSSPQWPGLSKKKLWRPPDSRRNAQLLPGLLQRLTQFCCFLNHPLFLLLKLSALQVFDMWAILARKGLEQKKTH